MKRLTVQHWYLARYDGPSTPVDRDDAVGASRDCSDERALGGRGRLESRR